MSHLNTNLKWEDVFIQESVELEEKMQSFEMDDLRKSKLRLSLEKNVLDWKKYENWVLENVHCSSLKETLNEAVLKNFATNARQAYEIYSNYDFWSEDLLPAFIWDNQLVVFGLQYNENLLKIQNHIFILARPSVLDFLGKAVFTEALDATEEELNELEKSTSMTHSRIEGLEMDIKPPVLDLKEVAVDTVPNFQNENLNTTADILAFPEPVAVSPPPTPTPAPTTARETDENTIWEFITERHDEYSFEARKHFSAYVVLKINYNTTKVFKMDKDLQDLQINEKLFEYNLQDDNPFRKVYESGVSESFSVSQLGLNLLNFKYACITALRRSNQVVGFLIGFKDNNLSENDQHMLEDLARESA